MWKLTLKLLLVENESESDFLYKCVQSTLSLSLSMVTCAKCPYTTRHPFFWPGLSHHRAGINNYVWKFSRNICGRRKCTWSSISYSELAGNATIHLKIQFNKSRENQQNHWSGYLQFNDFKTAKGQTSILKITCIYHPCFWYLPPQLQPGLSPRCAGGSANYYLAFQCAMHHIIDI